MNREKLANGVYYSSFDGNFKKSRLMISLQAPLSRENITQTALLPFLLERGTAQYPDMTKLKRRLDTLYGSELYSSASVYGFSRIISVTIAGADAKLLEGARGISKQRAKLLYDVIFDPAVKDGAFSDADVDIERAKLLDMIRSEINEKRGYALRLTSQKFFENDERSLPSNGFIEDLDSISGKSLYKAYKQFIASARVEIIYSGSEPEKMKKIVSQLFAQRKMKPKRLKTPSAIAYGDERALTIPLEVEQDKLVLMFTAGEKLSERELSALSLASSLFGGAPMSRLFQNVREKQSLCYYCSARAAVTSYAMTVDSGVDHKNTARVREAVFEELKKLQNGEFDDDELNQIKLYQRSMLGGVADTAAGVTIWYLNSILRLGSLVSPEKTADVYDSITKEEIAAVLSKMKLSVSCVLTGKESSDE